MNQTTINPYGDIGALISPALHAIISNLNALGTPPKVSDLVGEVTDYINNYYYGGGATPQQLTELNSIAYNAINSYTSNLVLQGNSMYNANQMAFINMLIGPGMTANTAPASFADVVADVEDNIGISQLTVAEQTPLFLATTVGSEAAAYWANELLNPAASAWAAYFTLPNPGKQYMNSLLWNVGAMNGALATYGASMTGMVEPGRAAYGRRKRCGC